jgi:hypothetical protein
MHLAWLVSAVHAVNGDDGTMRIEGAGVDTLVVSGDLPHIVEVVLAMRVVGRADEWLQDQVVTVSCRWPSGTEMEVARERLRVPEARLLTPTREVGVLLPARCAWLAEAGKHDLTVSLDGARTAQLSVTVVGST